MPGPLPGFLFSLPLSLFLAFALNVLAIVLCGTRCSDSVPLRGARLGPAAVRRPRLGPAAVRRPPTVAGQHLQGRDRVVADTGPNRRAIMTPRPMMAQATLAKNLARPGGGHPSARLSGEPICPRPDSEAMAWPWRQVWETSERMSGASTQRVVGKCNSTSTRRVIGWSKLSWGTTMHTWMVVLIVALMAEPVSPKHQANVFGGGGVDSAALSLLPSDGHYGSIYINNSIYSTKHVAANGNTSAPMSAKTTTDPTHSTSTPRTKRNARDFFPEHSTMQTPYRTKTAMAGQFPEMREKTSVETVANATVFPPIKISPELARNLNQVFRSNNESLIRHYSLHGTHHFWSKKIPKSPTTWDFYGIYRYLRSRVRRISDPIYRKMRIKELARQKTNIRQQIQNIIDEARKMLQTPTIIITQMPNNNFPTLEISSQRQFAHSFYVNNIKSNDPAQTEEPSPTSTPTTPPSDTQSSIFSETSDTLPNPTSYPTVFSPEHSRSIYNTIRYDTIRYDSILYYTILYYTILYYTILYYTILYYTIPYHTIV